MTVPGSHRRMLRVAVLAAAAGLALTGCGGSGQPSTVPVKTVNGTLYVAATGPPYPVYLTQLGRRSGIASPV
jgi:ABC-type glycerol-3-phosphate transport system substrate-binding protein